MQKKIIKELVYSKFNKESIEKIENVNEGVSTTVFKIITPKDNYFLRIEKNSKYAMSTQVEVHKLLKSYNVLVPEVYAAEDYSQSLEGYSFMIVKEVVGKSLHQIKNSNKNRFKKVAHKVLTEAGKQMAKVSRIPVNKFGPIRKDSIFKSCFIGMYSSYIHYLESCFIEQSKYLGRQGFKFFSGKDVAFFKSLINDSFSNINPTLAHGDLNLEHIFVDKNDALSGIIDWGDIKGTSRFYDIAHMTAQNTKHINAFIEGFKSQKILEEKEKLEILLTRICICFSKLAWIHKHVDTNITSHRYYQILSQDLLSLRDLH